MPIQERHLAAILFTDIVGYTSMMQQNETRAVAVIRHYLEALDRLVLRYQGEVLNNYGDGSLCSFPSVQKAMNCAIDLQRELQTELVVPLRVGLHMGEILFESGKVFGDGVNVASRIQSLGIANSILFSSEVFTMVRNQPEFKMVSLGSFHFKNVNEPMEVFALANDGLVVPDKRKMEGKLQDKKNNRKKWIIASIILMSLFLSMYLIFTVLVNKNAKERHVNVTDRSIAIKPFDDFSPTKDQQYFGDGMMDEILDRLYKIEGLRIPSRTTMMKYRDSDMTMTEIGKELGVTIMLEGSVRKSGDRVKITVQLIDAIHDQHLWSESYEREIKDVFSIQSEVAEKVAEVLKVKISPETRERIEQVPTKNQLAYDLFLYANSRLWEDGVDKELEQVIKMDTSFAPAYAALGMNISTGGKNGFSKDSFNKAYPYFMKALELDPNLPSAHAWLATAYLYGKRDIVLAGVEWKKVIKLNPSGVEWAMAYWYYLMYAGKFNEALEYSLERIKNDERWGGFLCESYYRAGQKEQALLNIEFLDGDDKRDLAKMWLLLGNVEKAKGLINSFKTDNHPEAMACKASIYFRMGQSQEATELLDQMKQMSEKTIQGRPAFNVAAAYAYMGEINTAFEWLQKSYDHDENMTWLKGESFFEPLHSDPRWQFILDKVGFPR